MKLKILFIDCWNNIGDFFREQRNRIEGLENVNLYRDNTIFNKVIRFLGIKIYMPLIYFAYGSWKKKIQNYDLIILDSRKTSEYAIKLIKKVDKNKRIVIWYWNKVTDRELSPLLCKAMQCETWTFDKEDAKKYDMSYNNTYYFEYVEMKKSTKEYDVFFVGIERPGRLEELKQLQSVLEQYNKNIEIHLTKSKLVKPNSKYEYKPIISYKEVLNKISKTNAILDLTQPNQYGLTLRAMESLFFNKKLITNNKKIIEYDFYNKENIFIIGVDSYNRLNKFLESNYKEIDNKIIEKYKFDNWLNRIIERKCF